MGEITHFYVKSPPIVLKKNKIFSIKEKKFSCNLVSLSPFSHEGDYIFQSTVFTTSSSLNHFFEKHRTSTMKTILNLARCNMRQMLGVKRVGFNIVRLALTDPFRFKTWEYFKSICCFCFDSLTDY